MVSLGSEYLHRAALPWQFLKQAQTEVTATFHAADVQWLIVVCISIYFVGFIWLLRALNPVRHLGDTATWIMSVTLFALGAFVYLVNYDQAPMNTDALVLFFGITLFFGLRCWRAVEAQRRRSFNLAGVVVAGALVLLSIGAVWHPESFQTFQYRGQARWSGLWDNPNTFGILMGVGVVIAVGGAVGRLLAKGQSRSNAELGARSAEWWRLVKVVLSLTAAGICGLGLVKSYSRGAWLGVVCGLGYLIWNRTNRETREQTGIPHPASGNLLPIRCGEGVFSCRSCFSWLSRNWLLVAAIVVSVVVLAFWNGRHTERTFARRMASVANGQDFSSRNRVAAWVGSLQMLADKPWLGFGWNQPERAYEEWYCPVQIPEAMAIQLNDYFTLGTTLGIPALVCFVAFVGMNLMRSAECGMRNEEAETDTSPDLRQYPHPACGHPLPSDGRGPSGEGVALPQPVPRPIPPSLIRRADTFSQLMGEGNPASGGQAEREGNDGSLPFVCRAGGIVLLVGFWFDGGLFKLATSSLFWILLALGSFGREAGRESRIANRGGTQCT